MTFLSSKKPPFKVSFTEKKARKIFRIFDKNHGLTPLKIWKFFDNSRISFLRLKSLPLRKQYNEMTNQGPGFFFYQNRGLRWLDTVIQGQYLPSLSINYVTINKDLEKLPPELYQIKIKICYDQGCNDIGVVIATKCRHYLFYLQQYFSVLGTVLPKPFTEAFSYNSCLDVREV